MEEIKIYLYVDSENINNYCFVKNKKVFIKINDFNNKKMLFFTEYMLVFQKID